MKKRIICCPFASKVGFNGSANMDGNKKSIEIYIKNACVSCFSAKLYNPDCDVAFVHNLKEIPEEFLKFFSKFGIKNIHVEYEKFTFPADYKWSLAFYKLCILDYMANISSYDSIVILDTDTCFIGSLDAMWDICQDRLMLYNVQHAADLEAFQNRMSEYRLLYNNTCYPTVWGGEFIAGSKTILKNFVAECEIVYNKIIQENFITNFGDEFITFCAAENYAYPICDAAPYIRRYWTTNIYYQAYTDHGLMLRILHIPNEKNTGFIRVYDYIQKKSCMPPNRLLFRIMGLPKLKRPIYLRNVLFELVRKFKRIPEKIMGI